MIAYIGLYVKFVKMEIVICKLYVFLIQYLCRKIPNLQKMILCFQKLQLFKYMVILTKQQIIFLSRVSIYK